MYKRLLSDAAIYGIGSVLIKGLGFFTLPIYTRIFSPVDYGVITMLSMIAGIISIFMNSGLDSAQSYYFMRAKNKGDISESYVITTIAHLRIAMGVVVGIVVYFSTDLIIRFFFPETIPSYYLYLITISVFIANLLSQNIEILRLVHKPWHYMVFTFIQSLLNIVLILYFCYYQEKGVVGYLFGGIGAVGFSLALTFISTKQYRQKYSFDFATNKEFLLYGLPIIPTGLMIWIMQISDRWFISNNLGIEETGIYAVGAKFAMLTALVVETFRKAWWPIAMDMMYKKEGPLFFKTISSWYVVFGCFIAIIITLLSPYFIMYLTPKEYHESWRIVGILCWSSILYGFFQISAIGLFYSKKTNLNLYIQTVGAISNILLNILLIPQLGVYGAALATVFSLLVSNFISMLVSNKFYPIEWNWLLMLIVIPFSLSFIYFYSS